MRIAIPVWDGQVSPVFDVARRVEIYELGSDAVTSVSTHRLHEGRAASELAELGIGVLICSAISAELETNLWIAGIEVVSEVCGEVEEIVDQYLNGDHELSRFQSPARRPRRRTDRISPGTSAPKVRTPR